MKEEMIPTPAPMGVKNGLLSMHTVQVPGKNIKHETDQSEEFSASKSESKSPKHIRRRRLTREHIALLEAEFRRDSIFSSSRITALATRLQLGRTKIYKWSWDRRKKHIAEQQQRNN